MNHPTGRIAPQASERAIADHYFGSTRPSMAEIKATVCDFYLIHPTELIGPGREDRVVVARQMFMYFAYRYTPFSLHRVGQYVNRNHHTTVWHAVKKIEKKIVRHASLCDDILALRVRISERVERRLYGDNHAGL
jgi:chromosomal replication initiation ATPase DnaA